MRTDEDNKECPETLGEYRTMCAAIGGNGCEAVKLLDEKIASQGKDALVIVDDSQMRALLMPKLGLPGL